MATLGIEGLSLEQWRQQLAVALGDAPADLLIRNARVVNVASGEIETANVAVVHGRIAGVGDYTEGKEELDLAGAYLAPSFIDGHVHVESSLLWIDQFARAVVPHGTGAVVTDPHEIANVAGLAGIEALMEASADLPLGVFFTVPSCVPASPMESAGAEMTPELIGEALRLPRVVALGEMMNFPGVLAGDPEIYRKLVAPAPRRDGHAPGLAGRQLNAYAGSGMGSDHESTRLEEAREKLRRGLMIMIREGSTEHNLLELLPLVTDQTYPRCCFASDDRDCATLLHDGHMDAVLRKAIGAGLDPIRAIRMATLNTAEYWGLPGFGMVAPGYWANLVVFDRLDDIRPRLVLYRGAVVAREGKPAFETEVTIPGELLHTVHVAPLALACLQLPAEPKMTAVGAIPGQIVTRKLEVEPKVVNGLAVADPERDLLKLVVVERHRATGRVGVGLVQGFGLERGALASSIAHDAHNIVAVGVSDEDLLLAIGTVAEMQGGLAAVADGQVLATLPLPVAGILSPEPLEKVAAAYERVEEAARSLGSTVPAPFALLSFMALSVIPEARVTDRGLVVL
ncbi:adenine deaminase [Thermomicrobiaceae bacterium CFH 74404]|uniref:Adenine deaminase n=1 Tax=Thermalbibacter longus TaxID=2951981 RepID=A0AA41WAM5_9BACT|nr:adenine deaminase [Thermalbibacter longus]MCM8748871.1 adenine deaminase [Thermalbibacter longus]